jgi:hypothetical protein
MSFVVEDGEALCSIEEKGAALSERLRKAQALVDFALVSTATNTTQANAAINVSAQLALCLADFEAFQTELRGFIGRYRLRAKWVSF